MNIQILLLLPLITLAVGKFTCSKTDCYECVDEKCHLVCQGKECPNCPDGKCCDGRKCNVCIESICCSSVECNRCVRNERNTCKEATSVCDNSTQHKCGLTTDKFEEYRNHSNNGLHNIRTIIKLKNLVNNTNAIKAPIAVNITNIRDILVNGTQLANKLRIKTCCFVVHPQECHIIRNILKQICFTRRHTECSHLCSNATNILIKISPTVARKCIIIATYPYYYCGYYALEDCSACYQCGSEKKSECINDSKCSDTCKDSILPRRFYNVPYYTNMPNNGTEVTDLLSSD